MSTRIEEDLLGTREVSDEHYYGIHTLRALENFQISRGTMNDEPEFIKAMVQVKKATALANQELQALPADIAEAICAACDEVLERGRCMDQFPTDSFQGGAGTSVNMNTNEVIANLALELLGLPKGSYDVINPNDHVNKSQSTNDAYPTGFRLALYTLSQDFLRAVEELAASLRAKGQQFEQVLKMGRTQLQDAVPMTLGQTFEAYAENMAEEVSRITVAADLLLEVNLGGTAIGTGLNAPPNFPKVAAKHLAEITGYPVSSSRNLLESSYDNGAYIALHSTVKRTAAKVSKICNDLRLMSSGPRAGLNEINLPQMQAGSSIMPAKVNPVIPEVVNQICFKVFGNDVAVCFAAEAGQLELNVMEPALSQSMFESLHLLTRGLDTLRTRCVDGITANEEVCRDAALRSIGIVTYLNDVIGHHLGDVIGKECARSGRSVREVALEMGVLGEAELDQILSTENLIKPRYHGRIYAAGEKGLPEGVTLRRA
ncbi:Aspartate ammonia-lyase [Actinomyces bovis]|uniref:Aspartate ammonia-lyase n=1 Tax=Actinomyces bovis TaxID=1658 RepID=A0ABY1VLV6_9ACTO|nr:aspartate ammonia-lyase [Actinomyces bovis]SPT53065.1 Aspartate ammonia-lyase [Actinomyces bovis]VEG52993.1 Aspartate ammonia-lyase [Actinomyces israelii]